MTRRRAAAEPHVQRSRSSARAACARHRRPRRSTTDAKDVATGGPPRRIAPRVAPRDERGRSASLVPRGSREPPLACRPDRRSGTSRRRGRRRARRALDPARPPRGQRRARRRTPPSSSNQRGTVALRSSVAHTSTPCAAAASSTCWYHSRQSSSSRRAGARAGPVEAEAHECTPSSASSARSSCVAVARVVAGRRAPPVGQRCRTPSVASGRRTRAEQRLGASVIGQTLKRRRVHSSPVSVAASARTPDELDHVDVAGETAQLAVLACGSAVTPVGQALELHRRASAPRTGSAASHRRAAMLTAEPM